LQNNQFCFSDKLNSKLGLGTWQFGGSNWVKGKATGWGDFDKSKALEIIQVAINNGIQFFDTSDAYGRGLSEEILGEAFQLANISREDIVICTKFGHRELENDEFIQDFSAEWLEYSVSKSLKRLKLDYLDVILMHSPRDGFDWNNYDKSPFENLIKRGLIKSYGVSSRSVYGAEKVMDSGFGTVLEVIYNLLDRRAEEILFTKAEIENYEIIARVPLASGFLTSKNIKTKPVFDVNNYRSDMNARDVDWLFESAQKLGYLEEMEGGISGQALNFCLKNDRVTIVIPGARNLGQLNQNLDAKLLPQLTKKHFDTIKNLVPNVPEWWKPKV
jgi:aryl-alcohol dehydrogenase-like predicted oxidoreductase